MAAHGGATVQGDLARGTIAEIKGLTVDSLKRVLRSENLPLSGIKHQLQVRLFDYVQQLQHSNQEARLKQLRDNIRSNGHVYSGNGAYPSPFSSHTPASSASPQYNSNQSPGPRLPLAPSFLAMPANMGVSQSRISFKPSPFYTIQKTLAPIRELDPREKTRDTARVPITLDTIVANDLANDSSLRVMVFCAAQSYDAAWKPVDIAFPQHAELKVNQEDIKTNLKGLKNKPGSTRPADITPFLRKKSNFPNSIELVYALTNQRYFFVVNLVRTRSIESLVSDLRKGKYISKNRILREMRSRATIEDVVVESTKMSLKDPVQMTRIDTPCRGMSCKHNECFDAAVYLYLQEQAPTWICPICSRSTPWEQLVFDQFVEDILLNTPSDAEQVTVEPDGQWHLRAAAESRPQQAPQTQSRKEVDPIFSELTVVNGNDSDEDLVEISSHQPTNRGLLRDSSVDRRGTPSDIRTPSHNSYMPPPAQPRASGTPSAPLTSSRGTKRPISQVIDLTLSDEDEDEGPPVSRIKRPSFSSQPSDSIGRINAYDSDTTGANVDSSNRRGEGSTLADGREDIRDPMFDDFTLPPLLNIVSRGDRPSWDDSGGRADYRNGDTSRYGGYTNADGTPFDIPWSY